MHGTSDAHDAEHRCDGQTRRAILKRLCAIADLRSLAHVLLHRSLYALAWVALEWLAVAGRRTDARRSSEEHRRTQRIGRQDPYGAGPRRHETPGDPA